MKHERTYLFTLTALLLSLSSLVVSGQDLGRQKPARPSATPRIDITGRPDDDRPGARQPTNDKVGPTPTPTPVPTPEPCHFCKIIPPDRFVRGMEAEVDLGSTRPSATVRGFARILRKQDETKIDLEVRGLEEDITYYLYAIDENGRLTQLKALKMGSKTGELDATTVLDSFALMLSTEPGLKTLGPTTKIDLITKWPKRFYESKLFQEYRPVRIDNPINRPKPDPPE